jgi:diguanylate cyclase (GGDEF)-like protein
MGVPSHTRAHEHGPPGGVLGLVRYVAEHGPRGSRVLDVTGDWEPLFGGVEPALPSLIESRLYAAADRERYRAAMAELAKADVAEAELRLRGRDGEIRWVLARAVLRERRGETVVVDGLLLDLGTLSLDEGPLLHVGDLGSVLESLDEHIYSAELTRDGSYREFFAGPGAERFLGGDVPAGMDEADAWYECLHPDDHDDYWAALHRLFDGRPVDIQYRICGFDGQVRWVLERCRPRQVDADRVLFDGICHDVTDRVLADREQRALREVSTAVAEGAAVEEVCRLVSRLVLGLLSATGGGVIRFDGSRGISVGSWSETAPTVPPGTSFDLTPGLAVTEVWRTGRTAISGDYEEIEGEGADIVRPHAISRGVASPIRVAGQLWGAFLVLLSEGERLPSDCAQRLERFADLVALAIANAEAHERLSVQALTDPLTGLANHRAFHERLAQEVDRARRHDRDLALVLIDVDRFKEINDTFGHQLGDQILAEAANALTGVIRSEEVLARIGGDEFALLLPECDAADAHLVAERARVALSDRAFAGGVHLTISAGVSDVRQGPSAGELFRLSDGALYWSKASGRNVVWIYSPDVVEELSATERAERLARSQALAGLRALARAVDIKDPSTQRHSERVAELADRLAAACGWSDERRALIREAGVVHDVGKIGVPDLILRKPGALTAEEYEVVKQHAALGAQIASEILSVEQVTWIRHHHERHDGRGYPFGIGGDDVPDGAQLLALADAWDVMTSARTYKAPMKRGAALAECRSLAGTQFAPAAVEALMRLAESGRLPGMRQARRAR